MREGLRPKSDAAAAADPVEVRIEGADPFELVHRYRSRVNRIAGGDRRILVSKLPGMIHDRSGNCQHLGKELARQCIDFLSIRPAMEGPVAVNDLLKDFGVDGCLCLAVRHSFQKCDRRRLVRMFGSRRIHQDVRIDQNHGSGSTAGTDSRSISSGVPTGKLRLESSSTMARRSAREESPY